MSSWSPLPCGVGGVLRLELPGLHGRQHNRLFLHVANAHFRPHFVDTLAFGTAVTAHLTNQSMFCGGITPALAASRA
jgi:hypothetical protein